MKTKYALLISTTTSIAVNDDFSIRTIGRSSFNEAMQFESVEEAKKYIPNILKMIMHSDKYEDEIVQKLLRRDGYSIIEYQSNLCTNCQKALVEPGMGMCVKCSYSGTRGA